MQDQGVPNRVTEETTGQRPSVASGDLRLLYIYDARERRNLYVNAAVTPLLGYSPEAMAELRDSLLSHLIHPDDADRLSDVAGASGVADGAVRHAEVRLRHADGTWRRLAVREVVFAQDADGAAARILGIAEDVTDERRAEERHRILTGATVGISAADSVDEVARLAADATRHLLAGSAAVVVYYASEPSAEAVASPGTESAEGFAALLDDGHFFARVLAGRRLSVWNSAAVPPSSSAARLPRLLTDGAWGVLPLVGREGARVGVLLAKHPCGGPFTESEETALTQFGQITALVLENRRLFAELQTVNFHLSSSEERFRLATEAVNGHVYDWDRATDTVRRTAGTARLLGMAGEPPQAAASWWRQRIHPDDLQRVEAEAAQAGFDWASEYRVRHENGGYIWVSDHGRPVYDGNGDIVRVVGYTVDITDRKRAEIRSRRVFDSNVVGIIHWNLETGLITDANDRFLEMMAYTRADLAAGRLNFRAMTPPEWSGRNESGIAEIRSVGAGTPYEKEYFRKDGSRLPIIIGGALFDDSPSEGFSFILDISEQKATERALRESEEWFRSLAETVPQFIWIASADGVMEYINPQWEEYTGLTWEQTRGGGSQQAIHSDDYPRMRAGFIEAHTEGRAYTDEVRIRGRDGSYRWFQVQARPARDESGRVLRWFGATTDITEQKAAQERISSLNERLRRSMAESHHRIKNNLQVLSALSEMQTIGAQETVPVAVVSRLGQQIRTLAALHDLLTMEYRGRTDDGEFIALRSALSKLIGMMESVSGGRQILWECDDIQLPVKRTETFVLLLNELIQNAIKHGRGPIEVRVLSHQAVVTLSVCDDGDGFAPDFDPYTAANTGMELIEAMGRWDLQGEITYENRASGGACVTITFPLPSPVEVADAPATAAGPAPDPA